MTLERGSAAWVAADDGPIRLVATAADEVVPGDRRYLVRFRRPNGSTWMTATTTAPTTNPMTADAAVLTSQASTPPTPSTAWWTISSRWCTKP